MPKEALLEMFKVSPIVFLILTFIIVEGKTDLVLSLHVRFFVVQQVQVSLHPGAGP